jgi:hypothetical protein
MNPSSYCDLEAGDENALMVSVLKSLWALLKLRGKRLPKTDSGKWLLFFRALNMMARLMDERDIYEDLELKFDSTPKSVDDFVTDDTRIEALQQYGAKLRRRDKFNSSTRSSVSDHVWLPLFVSALVDNVSDAFCDDISVIVNAFEEENKEIANDLYEVQNTAAHFIADYIDEKIVAADSLHLYQMINHQSPWVMHLIDEVGRYLLHAVAGNSLINAETLNFVLKANPRAATHFGHKGISALHSLFQEYLEHWNYDKVRGTLSLQQGLIADSEFHWRNATHGAVQLRRPHG